MRWMITDSGMGGLSVCAGLERGLMERGAGAGIELLYVNATPEEEGGYNSLDSQSERIEVFDRFLSETYTRFAPDQIAIACNTLSVIYDDTRFSKSCPVPVKGIVDVGVQMSHEALSQYEDKNLIIFATETTTEANTYPSLIGSENVIIVAQACSNLASAISRDASGARCRHLLEDYVDEALLKFESKPTASLALLACTHYGYQSLAFKDILESRGVAANILNPNNLLVDQLLKEQRLDSKDSQEDLRVRFVSRFPIPRSEIETMEHYLKGVAPLTLGALQNQEVMPKLFQYP